MTQLAHGIVAWPELGATSIVSVDRSVARQEGVRLWLHVVQAHEEASRGEEGSRGVLQCWTDAPTKELLGDEVTQSIPRREWKASDVTPLPLPKLKRSVSIAIHLPRRLFFADKDEADGREVDTVDIRFTWRLQRSDGEVEWLGHPGQDGQVLIRLSPPQPGPHLEKQLRFHGEFAERASRGDGLSDNCEILTIDVRSGTKDLCSAFCDILMPCRGVVLERTKSTWHTSRSFDNIKDLSSKFLASLVVLRTELDQVIVLLPVCGVDLTVKLVRSHLCEHTIDVDTDGCGSGSVIVGRGHQKNLARLLRQCHRTAKAFLEKKSKSGRLPTPTSRRPPHDIRKDPLSLHTGLGFCTWEALGTGMPATFSSLTQVLDAFQARREVTNSISTLLIDDGWQHTQQENGKRTLVSFDLAPGLLQDESKEMQLLLRPNNLCPRLSQYVSDLRGRYRFIRHFGVWMTLSGYWDGLDPDPNGFFAQRYGPLHQVEIQDVLTSNPRSRREVFLPLFASLDSFWHDCFEAYKSAGISFVKIDAQAELDWIVRSDCDQIFYFDRAWTAITQAADDVFGPQSVIHCMAFGSRLLSSTLSYDQLSGSMLSLRNSDDTFPQVADAHTWHLYHNILNSLLTSTHPVFVPDADMFTSEMAGHLDWAAYHAAFRSVFSSSKIWISDAHPTAGGSSNTLDALLAVGLSDDGTALMTVQVGIGTKELVRSLPLSCSVFEDCTGTHGKPRPLIIASRWYDRSQRSTAIISAWNVGHSEQWAYGPPITRADVAEALKLDDQIEDGASHIYILHCRSSRHIEVINAVTLQQERLFSQMISTPLEVDNNFCCTIPPASWAILDVIPALSGSHVDEEKGAGGAGLSFTACCLGLLEKHAGLATVVAFQGRNTTFTATLCRAGRCAFAVVGHRRPLRICIELQDGTEVDAPVEKDYLPGTVTVISFDMLPFLHKLRRNEDGWEVTIETKILS